MNIKDFKKEIVKRNPNVENQVKKDLAFQVGRMLLNARLMKGMTQKDIAKKIGTKQPAIARIESGMGLPNLGILDRIAKKAFKTYLIPPRFSFMTEEDAFTTEIIHTNSILSSTTKNNYTEKNVNAYFLPIAINNNNFQIFEDQFAI